MARLHSFFLPPGSWPAAVGDRAWLPDEEVHHLATVLRGGGDLIRLFDGTGRSGLFRVLEANRKRAQVEAVRWEPVRVPDSGLTLAIGWSRSQRRGYLLEKAVELGALGIVFWEAGRSQGRMPDAPKTAWRERFVQAAKQCGASWLPTLAVQSGGVGGLADLCGRFDRAFLAWERAQERVLTPADLALGRSLVVIGPEGGLEDAEAAVLTERGVTAVTLGGTVLRWETAALYCLSLGWFAGQKQP